MVTSFNDFDRTSFVARASSGVYTSRATARAPRVVRARRGRVSRAPRESDATADARTRVARSVRALHASHVCSITRRLCIKRVRSPTFRGNCNHRYRRREPSRTVANRARPRRPPTTAGFLHAPLIAPLAPLRAEIGGDSERDGSPRGGGPLWIRGSLRTAAAAVAPARAARALVYG